MLNQGNVLLAREWTYSDNTLTLYWQKSKQTIGTANIKLILGLTWNRKELAGRHHGQESHIISKAGQIIMEYQTKWSYYLHPYSRNLTTRRRNLKHSFVRIRKICCSVVCSVDKNKSVQVTKVWRRIFLQILVKWYTLSVLNITCVKCPVKQG